MNLKTNLKNILFLDIETVPEFEHWSELSEEQQELFAKKTQYQRKEEFTPAAFYDRAGIWAEFAKIVCISVGYFTEVSKVKKLRITSFFGDYKHYTSLKLLTSILGIPSPKDDIDGSEVAQVYYQEKNMDRIVQYCEKDTIAVAQVLLRFNNEALLNDTDITSV
jgi:predicted PolB exonuclease-like 3'-5' exonuclease